MHTIPIIPINALCSKTIADNDLQCEDQLVTVVDTVQMFVNKSELVNN